MENINYYQWLCREHKQNVENTWKYRAREYVQNSLGTFILHTKNMFDGMGGPAPHMEGVNVQGVNVPKLF